MRLRFCLAILLLIPLVSARVLIYAKGFDPNAYNIYDQSGLQLEVHDINAFASFLRKAGFNVTVITDVEQATASDVIIVPGCTSISDADAARLVALARSGAGLIVDLHCASPFETLLGVERAGRYVGIRHGTLATDYVTVSGYYMTAGERSTCDAPACWGYESMYYLGDTLYAKDDAWRDVFTDASVLVYRTLGKGRVAVTGCLFCASPLLLENMVDWADNGRVDFPRVQVNRSAEVDEDGRVHDIITLVGPEGMSAILHYSADQCPLEKIDETPPQPLTGGKVSKVFVVLLKPLKDICITPDALVEFNYDGQLRDIIVRGETVRVGTPVTVPSPQIPMPQSLDDLLMWIAGILFLVFIVLLVLQVREGRTEQEEQKNRGVRRALTEKDKKKLVRLKIRALRLKEKEIQETLRLLTQQWMRGRLSEDEYQKTKTLYEAKLANIRAKIKILQEALSSSSSRKEDDEDNENEDNEDVNV